MTKCVLCGAELNEKDLLIKRHFQDYTQTFDLYQCAFCEMVQTVPMPNMTELMTKEYCDEYMAYRNPHLRKTKFSAERRLRKIAKHLTGKRKGASMLDIGCSTGWFLKRAKEKGFNVTGIEMNAYAVEKANKLLGCSAAICSSLEESQFGSASFDVVYSNQVIEHVPAPVEFIRKASSYLKVNGLLVIGTPNIASIAWRSLRGNWTTLQKPDHLVFFNPRSLNRALLEQCFDLLEFHSTGMPPIGWARRSKEIVDRNINRVDNQTHTRKPWHWSVKHWVLGRYLISNVLAMIIDLLNLGDTMYVIARKKEVK